MAGIDLCIKYECLHGYKDIDTTLFYKAESVLSTFLDTFSIKNIYKFELKAPVETDRWNGMDLRVSYCGGRAHCVCVFMGVKLCGRRIEFALMK